MIGEPERANLYSRSDTTAARFSDRRCRSCRNVLCAVYTYGQVFGRLRRNVGGTNQIADRVIGHQSSLAEPHPRAQAARGSGVMLYFGLYHAAGFLQSNQIAELVTRHASSPEFEQAKQPTWTFEPEATSTLMIVRHQTHVK